MSEERLSGLDLTKLVIKTCFKPYNFFLLFSSFLQRIFIVVIYNFLFLHMKDVSNPSITVMGFSSVAANIGEVFIFPLAKSIIERFGRENCFLFSLFVTGLRAILLGICTNHWLFFPIQFLHSFSFGLFYTSIVELLNLISPKEIFSTMFGVNQSLKKLARVFGTMLGGFIYKRYGGTVLFVGVGIVCCCWTCIVFLIFQFLFKTGINKKELLRKP